jgi:hypothetical protein
MPEEIVDLQGYCNLRLAVLSPVQYKILKSLLTSDLCIAFNSPCTRGN